ncbi:hypothetical protein KDH_72700 [Dictyobacter sp. S3.2.2.5]|uniref:DUF4375 domain-containing protein n=1 Tax=Dictyobacter halimunensis TaxID=3026934 RepID=A0ABQ6G5S3_9CHLR|nr:hypothetical protein KDH_72700 [Dictyobacter sp. S3.2.2.5]
MDTLWIWLLLVFVLIFAPAYLGSRYSQRRARQQMDETWHGDARPGSGRPAYRMPTIQVERSPLLYQQISQAREQRQGIVAAFRPVQTALIETLARPQASLLSVLEQRAIALYHEQEGTSWPEAAQAIREFTSMYGDQSIEPEPAVTSHADPMVMYLLLQAHSRQDAELYFRTCTGTGPEAAQAVIQQIEQMIEKSDLAPLEQGERDPDPLALDFLLRAGYSLLAIRYYRDCTGTNLQGAREAIQEYQARLVR